MSEDLNLTTWADVRAMALLYFAIRDCPMRSIVVKPGVLAALRQDPALRSANRFVRRPVHPPPTDPACFVLHAEGIDVWVAG